MNIFQEIICAVWGCNFKVYFTRFHNPKISTTTYFCSRCHNKMGSSCSIAAYEVSEKESEDLWRITNKENAEMHKRYGYDFKY